MTADVETPVGRDLPLPSAFDLWCTPTFHRSLRKISRSSFTKIRTPIELLLCPVNRRQIDSVGFHRAADSSTSTTLTAGGVDIGLAAPIAPDGATKIWRAL